jgi:ATP-dependent DNA helicase RecG
VPRTTNRVVLAPDAAVTELRGVGERRARLLARLGVRTVADLLALAPRRVERRGPVVELADLKEHLGASVHVHARVTGTRLVRQGRGRSLVRVALEGRDGRGRCDALYFNQPYLVDRFTKGGEVYLYGRVVEAPGIALAAPKLVRADDPPPGALELVYPATEGLGQPLLRSFVLRALELVGAAQPEPVPRELLARLDLPTLPEALASVHRPLDPAQLERGVRRLRFEAALEVQAELHERRRARAHGDAAVVSSSAEERAAIACALPFAPTRAQARVFDELAHDLGRAAPMRRLLQGDVGAGKTACAFFAVALVARAGFQAALLAPTEVLAEQHFASERERLAGLGVKSALLVGSQRADVRRRVERELASGALPCVFGTHALLAEGVRFARLALAVVDEQHRFGVLQRERLFAKGRGVHQLLMTATPIPRTLATALWADLDTSVLDERPPGRQPPRTHVLPHTELVRIERHLVQRLARGERALWVLPRIESSSAGRGAVAAAEAFAAGPLAAHGVELVHGDLPAPERQRRLARFRSGAARLLVGTTVLEVGLDVPQATVVVVEGAERLGAAQLHQLRGRVGRGGGESWCFLVAASEALPRLEWLATVHDGFEVAERDLALRGMGDLVGDRQSGPNSEGLGDGEPDLALWNAAREAVAADPALRELYAARSASRR